MDKVFRIGIISGRLGDVDGVSLEVDKWLNALAGQGHTLFTIAGRYGKTLDSLPEANQLLLKQISFDSPEQLHYEKILFPYLSKNPPHLNGNTKNSILDDLTAQGNQVACRLFEYVQDNSIDVIIAENTNAMPMTLLGSLGVYDLAVKKRVATIFHHHDFWWERSRFSQNHIESLLTRIMPPAEVGNEHVVISSYAAHILRSIKRVHPYVIPNCEDFKNLTALDDYNREFRRDLGFKEDDILIVQPTRIVRRKRIEDSLELVGRLLQKHPALRKKVHYIVSLFQGDEHDEDYVEEIKSLARGKEISLHLISKRVSSNRGLDPEGRRIYTNRDVLANADMVTYLPVWEGFGNALLEAIAAHKAVVITTYLVYKTDIKVTGLKNIEIRDQYDTEGKLQIPDEAVEEMYYLLTHPEEREEIIEKNFNIAKKEFGLDTLNLKLKNLLSDYSDEIRASRKRIEKSKRSYSV